MTDTTASPAGVSAGEVARALGVDKSTVGRWIAQGRITEVKAIIGLLWLERFVRGR